MNKITLMLFLSVITIDLFSMQNQKFHYVLLKNNLYAPHLVIADHRLDASEQATIEPTAEKWFGPWEDSLTDEFRSITPQAILHFRAIKKIVNYINTIKGSTISDLQHGMWRTQRGLRLDIDPYPGKYPYLERSLALCTPWGNFCITTALRYIPGLLSFVSAHREYHLNVGLFSVDGYQVTAVDGEQLPTLIMHDGEPWSGRGGVSFIPNVWEDMEQMSNQKKLPEEKDQQFDRAGTPRKRSAEIDNLQPAKRSKIE